MMKYNACIKLLAVSIAAVIFVSAVPSVLSEIEKENLYQSSISVPSTINVLMLNGSVITMNLDDYLKGVVSAEMYPTWQIEALKAQAVASRSFAIANTHHDHVSVDVCTDSGCCQDWQEGPYSKNVVKAVTETHNIVITYNGEIAGETLFFAHCNGHTRNSEDYCPGGHCWDYVPYLRGVPCDCGYGEYYGHGVGMCQRGAKAMAEQGYSYEDILKQYYTGIEVEGGSPTPQIIVEDADTIWNTSTVYSSDLINTTSNVTPRILLEYANTIYHSDLNPSTDLINVTGSVTPRILAEYANSIYHNDLYEIPTDLANLASEVPPKIIIEYANSNYYEKLIFPKELINDTTPPIITNVTVTNITDNSATIIWDTDEIADSLVKYGKVFGVYTESEEDALFVKNHTIELPGLLSGTCYYFVVNSTDRSENSAESSEYSFTTTGVPNNPIVSISTDKYEYTASETMLINLMLANPTEEWQSVYFAWRLDLPDYGLHRGILNKSLYLPPDYEQTFTIPFTLGDYRIPFNASWYVALYDTTTLEVISEDTADWRYVPGAEARGEAIPEEIAEEIIKTVEIEEVELSG